MDYEDSLKYYRDLKNSLDTAFDDGLEKGIVKGIEKGRKEGKEEEKEQVAINGLKAGVPEDLIIKMTGVSKEKLEQLKRKLKNN